MSKLLVICGPTSTGKTALAVSLAKKFNGEIISSDSRQVYRGMDIGTGKDIPKGAKIKYPWFSPYGYYEIDGIKIWGYDLADPKKEFSIAQYLKFADRLIGDIVKRKKLPILVGGTGLYIKGVVDGVTTALIPKNRGLRKNLEGRSTDELFEKLAQMDSVKAGTMNSSDRKNPRRLVRAIEVATWKLGHGGRGEETKEKKIDPLFIGLSAPGETIGKRIKARIQTRLKDGVKAEIEALIKKKVSWDSQAMTSIGYRQWKEFFEGKIDEAEVSRRWELEEIKYVKRQVTWLKRDRRIAWFDITKGNFAVGVEKLVEKWHNSGNNAKKN